MMTTAAIALSRSVFTCVLVASLSSTGGVQFGASAQTVEDQTVVNIEKRVKALIESDAVRDQAWGAFFAGEFHLKAFTPILLRLLASNDARINSGWLKQVVLDSLIQLDASVASAVLSPLFDWFSDEVIILCAKSPVENRQLLFSLLERKLTGEEWVAISNILTANKAPGLAALLMGKLKITALVSVTDERGLSGGGGFGTMCVGCGGSGLAEGFPPIAAYHLRYDQSDGVVLFAPGRHPIYYERSVAPAGETPPASKHNTWVDRDAFRVEYLAELLSLPFESLCLKSQPSLYVTWRSKKQFIREVSQFRRRLRTCYSETVNELLKEGLLASDEASILTPMITLEVTDYRRNKRIPIPRVE
jgi:hypothetical protein